MMTNKDHSRDKDTQEIDLDYYRLVAQTQNDPEILQGELLDLIDEVSKSDRVTT